MNSLYVCFNFFVRMIMALKGSYLILSTFMVLFFCQANAGPSAVGTKEERSACGSNFFAETGIIQSPNYPRSYRSSARCTWVITVPEDNRVNLVFQDFQLEPESDCDYDYVKVYDGSRSSAPLLGNFCGTTTPGSIQSSGNTMTIQFTTDASLNYRGFSAQFTKVPATTVTECSNPKSNSSIDWVYHQGYCYNAYTANSFTFLGGKEFCQRNGAVLTSVHSPQEMNFIHSLVQTYSSDFWIGLRKQFLSEYKWEDGTPVDYLNWPSEDTDDEDYGFSPFEGSTYGYSYNEDAICASLRPPANSWNRRPCDNRYHVICKYKDVSDASTNTANWTTAPHTMSEHTLPGFCPDEWYTFGDKCYKVVGKSSSREHKGWSDANDQCETMGSSLVSIHSAEEQGFLNTLVMDIRYKVLIGLRRPYGGAAFSWADNSALDFSNWNEGEPNNHLGTNENCVQMLYSYGVIGKWNDVPCHLRFPFICQKYRDPAITEPGIDPSVCTSPEGWLRIATSCYRVFHGNGSRSSWSEAQAHCESHQANLASVKNFQVTVDLRTHLEELEGYFWIGINSTTKHRYLWIGGSPLIYSNWQADQPREASEESNCVAVNTEGEWMVRDCNQSLPFICEMSEASEVPTLAPHHYNMTCPSDSPKWHDFGGEYCYSIEINQRLKWYEASCHCTEEGGFLASFHSIHEVNVIRHHLKHFDMFVHIGFERDRLGRFVWSDGSPIDFDNWNSGEPSRNSEQCAAMNTATGKWSDIQCGETYGYICSALKVPENEEFATPGSYKQEGEDKLSPGFIALISLCVLTLLVISAVALYYYVYPSMRSKRSDSAPFAKMEE